jgi:anaerobic ribonucleoside-triphosphate reductase activating protein
MLRYASYDIVFREIPGEVTLALNLSGCPNRCRGCHSPHLQEDAGEELTQGVLSSLLGAYGSAITCVCFMGGDAAPKEVSHLAQFVRQYARWKTAWYSGLPTFRATDAQVFDYVKLGPYIEDLGGLDSPATNQRLYRIENSRWVDITGEIACRPERI